MKKGFTLVEIVISIGILLIVGISTTFFVLNKKNNNELERVTKEILEAANAYVKIEKDKNGNIYANKIVGGAKGVKIPLTNLISSGYIDKELANKVYDSNPKLDNNQDYYILFVENTLNYCDDGSYVSISSWMNKGDVIYLCDNLSSDGYDSNTLYGKIIEDYEKNGISGCLPGKEDGLCYFKKNNKTIDNDGIYYYTGEVSNNILKIGNELFYIVRTTENNGVKVVKYNSMNLEPISIYVNIFDTNVTYNVAATGWHRLDYYYAGTNIVNDRYSINLSSTEYNYIRVNGDLFHAVTDIQFSKDWSDSTEKHLQFKSDMYDSILEVSLKSPLHTFAYIPIYRWFETNQHIYENIIINNYNWCYDWNDDYFSTTFGGIKQSDFNCKELISQEHRFGLLNIAEYNAILKRVGEREGTIMYDVEFDGIAGGDLIGITTYMTSYLSLHANYSYSSPSMSYLAKIRPALVLKGDLLIENGKGDINDPYILKY